MSVPRLFDEPSLADQQEHERWLEREMSRTNQAYDRTPVAVVEGDYKLPLAFCKDGSAWQLLYQPVGEQGTREWLWIERPPIPGSLRSLSGQYRDEADQRRERMYEDPDAGKPFLPEDDIPFPEVTAGRDGRESGETRQMRCALRIGHGGSHLPVYTTQTAPFPGECGAIVGRPQ